MPKKKNGKLFRSLKKGLEEILAYQEGKISLVTEVFEFVLKSPPKYKAKEIKKIRSKRDYSQSIFAKVLNVSTKTVQSWESGKRTPSHAALRLIEIVDKGIYQPEIVRKV